MKTFVGIDVGAPRKGYHAVAIAEGRLVAKMQSCDPRIIASWCRQQGALVVAVDAPCRWRGVGGPARAAERELAADRIACFSTPTEARALGHAFYTWMFAGMELYAALGSTHPVWDGTPAPSGVAIETFPQAVACALAGEIVSAKAKLSIRSALLLKQGLDVSSLPTIDDVDAALCAVAAAAFASGRAKSYGDAAGGFIVVPRWTPDRASVAKPASPQRRKPDESGKAFEAIPARLPSLNASERLQLASVLEVRGGAKGSGGTKGSGR